MLKMGCVKVDITPDFPVYLCGYAARNSLSNTVEEHIEAGVMVIVQGKKKLLLITLDMTGICVKQCNRIYSDLKAATGYDASDIYLCCSHTHFAPGFGDKYITFPGGQLPLGIYPAEEKYYDFWLKQVVSGIKNAEKKIEPVELEETEIPVSCVSFNRRTVIKETGMVETNYLWPENNADKYEYQPVDTTFNVWRFKAGGEVRAVIGRFGCHPVTGGKEFYGVSADYPGYFQKYVEEFFGCPGFFMLGCAGDVVPRQRNGSARKDIGCVLATSIRLAERTFRKVGEFTLESKIAEIPMRLVMKCDRASADKLWAAELKRAKAMKKYDNELGLIAYKHEFVKLYPEDKVKLPIRFLRLGDKVLVGLPFETLTEIGQKIQMACPNAVVTSITGGYEGYMPLAKEYKRGGYETDRGARFNKNAGNQLVEFVVKMLEKF